MNKDNIYNAKEFLHTCVEEYHIELCYSRILELLDRQFKIRKGNKWVAEAIRDDFLQVDQGTLDFLIGAGWGTRFAVDGANETEEELWLGLKSHQCLARFSYLLNQGSAPPNWDYKDVIARVPYSKEPIYIPWMRLVELTGVKETLYHDVSIRGLARDRLLELIKMIKGLPRYHVAHLRKHADTAEYSRLDIYAGGCIRVLIKEHFNLPDYATHTRGIGKDLLGLELPVYKFLLGNGWREFHRISGKNPNAAGQMDQLIARIRFLLQDKRVPKTWRYGSTIVERDDRLYYYEKEAVKGSGFHLPTEF